MTADSEPFSVIEKLNSFHEIDPFDCGTEPLDRFLKRYALLNQKAGGAQSYIVCRGERRVVGYYTLTVGAVEHAEAPTRIGKGLARHPIPVMVLAHLAIDKGQQRRGLGRALLKNALLRTAQAADMRGLERFSSMRRTTKRAPGMRRLTSSGAQPIRIISSY